MSNSAIKFEENAPIKKKRVKKEIKIEIVLDAFQESDLQFIVEDNKSFKIENIQTLRIPEAKIIK